MILQVLIATMNRINDDFLFQMNINSNYLVVNQCTENGVYESCNMVDNPKWINVKERGLSKSRNRALRATEADICVIADDDVHYLPNYEKIIVSCHEKYMEADIIAFIVTRNGNTRKKTFRTKKTWNSYIGAMKISSVEITFKTKKLKEHGLYFNPHLGAGASFYCGEESTFLFDALKRKLKILYLPIKIAQTDCDNSCWFKGYGESHLRSLGAAYYNMSSVFYKILSLQFIIRHKKLLDKKYNIFKGYRVMINGAKEYHHLYKKQQNL